MIRFAQSSAIAIAAACCIAAPQAAWAGTGSFRLPTPSPSPSSEVVGPVSPDIPESRATRAPAQRSTPTPAPTSSRTPAPAASPTPQTTRTATPSRRGDAEQPVPRRSAAPQPGAPAPASPLPRPVPRDDTAAGPLPVPRPDDAARLPADSSDTFAPSAAPRDFGADQTPASAASPDEDGGTNWLLWIGGLLALILAGLAAIIFARRATGQRAPATAPQIVKPKPRPAAGAVPAAVSGSLASPPSSPDRPASSAPVVAAASGPLGLAMTSRSLSLSLMAATLDYELTLINSGSEPMHGLEVQGDMIGAHASLSSDDQVASATRPMETRHELAELLPGEQQVFRGQLRLPFSAIRAVAQGRSPLLVPLSRWRVTARDSQLEPLVQTFLVGQKSDRRQQGIQPFRLDIGPGVFSQLVQRSFA